MLLELSMVEQRYLAVREALDSGDTITSIAMRYGINRRTLHRWLNLYANDGLGALADKSNKPDRCPHQIDPVIEARILSMRKAHPGWGKRTLRNKLRREFDNIPSQSAIYRALVRHNLIEPVKRRRKKQDYKRWERCRAMELWQMDVVGGIYLSDGTKLSAVTGIDDHSRFCVVAKLVPRATAKPVCDALIEALNRHGVPDQILTDNGKVFTNKLRNPSSLVMFDRICHNNGIKHILTAPYSPTTTGKVERLHRTMRKEFFNNSIFDTIEDAQAALDAWVIEYNTERENQAIGDIAPIRRFELAENKQLEVIDGELPDEGHPAAPKGVSRRVDDKGRITVVRHRYHVGKAFAGQSVVVESTEGLLHIHHNGTLVATHAKRHLPEEDDTMVGRPKATRASKPTIGDEVIRVVDSSGSINFAGTAYRVSNRYKRRDAGVRLVGDTVQITIDGELVRTHKARHDPAKEFGALAQPLGHKKGAGSVA